MLFILYSTILSYCLFLWNITPKYAYDADKVSWFSKSFYRRGRGKIWSAEQTPRIRRRQNAVVVLPYRLVSV